MCVCVFVCVWGGNSTPPPHVYTCTVLQNVLVGYVFMYVCVCMYVCMYVCISHVTLHTLFHHGCDITAGLMFPVLIMAWDDVI